MIIDYSTLYETAYVQGDVKIVHVNWFPRVERMATLAFCKIVISTIHESVQYCSKIESWIFQVDWQKRDLQMLPSSRHIGDNFAYNPTNNCNQPPWQLAVLRWTSLSEKGNVFISITMGRIGAFLVRIGWKIKVKMEKHV